MIYLDNAATGGHKPACVQNAVLASMKVCANPGRSGHALSVALAERVLACRTLLSELFDGYGFERVVFTQNCTQALNFALFGALKRGDHVIATCLEHNSVLRPLEHLKRRGVEVDIAPLTGTRFDPAVLSSLVRKNTRACCVTTASNVTGETPDLRAVRANLPADVLLIADGAQGAGHIPIRMREIGIDALAVAGHKGMHAIQGAAALLFSDRFDPTPTLFGGTGSESFNPDMPAYYPDRLESGTLSYPAIASLFEGALIVKANLKSHAAHLTELTGYVYAELSRLPRIEPYFSPNPCGIASFAHVNIPSEEVAGILSERFGIAVRGGLHCAPLIHRALGTFPSGLVRASFSPYQGKREADALLSALHSLDVTSA